MKAAEQPNKGRGRCVCAAAIVCLVALVALVALLAPASRGQDAKPNEYQVKAVYLYNFGRFVEWPAQAATAKGASFDICILGHDPFGPVLDSTVAGEKIDGQRVMVRRIVKVQEAAGCRILFITTSEESRLKDILSALERTGVLTVSDIPHFSERGGMIQLLEQGGKIRFEVNLTNAQDEGLTLSSDLLKVAAAVRKNSQPGD